MILKRLAASGGKLAIFLLLGLAICPLLHANTLDSSIVGMFPKDVTGLKYADLRGMRQFSWFPQFQAQLVPGSVLGFEKFVEEAQVQIPPSIDQVLWARISVSGSTQLVAVGSGRFDIETIKFFLDNRGVFPIKMGTYEVYAALTDLGMSDGYFSLIDSTTVAFGPMEGLRRILDIRAGNEASISGNPSVMNLIKRMNGESVFWSVLVSAEAGTTVQHLLPEMMKFPQANDLVGKIKELLISLSASENIQLDFKVDSASPGDAIVFSQLLDATLLSKRYQSGQDHPEWIKILDGIVATPNGNQLDIWLPLVDDQIQSLADQNTFNLLL